MADSGGGMGGGNAELERGLLRFLTCGSVDDGKSTLIGRLLYDSKLIYEDQLATLERDSRKHGTVDDDIDFALLVDGLEAERQQGITIDVAYRFFNTPKRSFIVADTPGHEQYTRNMATGASNCDVAIILIDARKGVLTQTKRHSYICSLLGIRHVVVAVNKIDLASWDHDRFDEIVADYRSFAKGLGFETVQPIPMSARYGDNVTDRSEKMNWYTGPTLVEFLETIDVESDLVKKPFRFPVQWVNRPNLDFRGFSGTIASGSIKVGERIVVAASGRESKVAKIVTYDGDLKSAGAGDAVTICLTDEIDIMRGDVLVGAKDRPEVADQFAAHLLWMAEEEMLPGRSYLMKIGAKTAPAKITGLKHKVDVDTMEHLAAKTLGLNDIGLCNLSTSSTIAFDSYKDNRDTGAFILIDRYTNATVGAGMIEFGLRRAANIHYHAALISRTEREKLNGHKPVVLWFTGLSGSGKSTIANLVERELYERHVRTFLLDGDNVRHGLNRDLGFTDADRVENVRRVGEVAKLFVEGGMVVLASFISPFRAERQVVRELLPEGEFVEIFVDTPVEDCIKRDPKGLYAKALKGEIEHFTGVTSPYEEPESPDILIRTRDLSAAEGASLVIEHLKSQGVI